MATSQDLCDCRDIRGRQAAAITRMVNLNSSVEATSTTEPSFKVLIYDKYGQDIISPILSVPKLRELGVTLHLQLHSRRDAVDDVPAVYFISPTAENVARICQDMRSNMYESYYLNFITAVPRQRLEELATAAIEAECVSYIMKVIDQYQSFISLEENLFTVRQQDLEPLSYYAINRPDTSDSDMEQMRDAIVDALFSVCVTLGTVPLIRCPRGNAAEMIAEALDKKLRENVRDARNSLFTGDVTTGQFSFQRPLLVLLDRSIDLATPLHHTWTYQALIHDLLELQLNRVNVREDDGSSVQASSQGRFKTYDLSSTDKFWREHRGSPFPAVAAAVETALDEYKAAGDKMKDLKVAVGADDQGADAALTENTAMLSSAIGSLPELLEKKKAIDMHTNIASALLQHIQARKLDLFFEMEEKILSKSSLDKSVLDVITDSNVGSPSDKLRLFIIYYLMVPEMADADLDHHVDALKQAGADISPLLYLKKWKAYSKMTVPASRLAASAAVVSTSSFSLKSVIQGVRNLVVADKNFPVTRLVDSLMEIKSTPETEDYRYFDPKVLRQSDSIPRTRSPFREAIVFIVGGGNYIEYQNLQDYCKRAGELKRIAYGASELMNSAEFLAQLSRLGAAE